MTAAPTPGGTSPARAHRDRTHYLYIAVIVAVFLGIVVGLVAPHFAVALKPLGAGFVAPVSFCTIVLGIGSLRSAAQIGKVGRRAARAARPPTSCSRSSPPP